MRIGFINDGGLTEFTKDYKQAKTPTDIFLFCFEETRVVSYQEELERETGFFSTTAKLSKLAESIVVCGCITDTLGHRRKSVLVAESGKLLGVSDMINAVDGEVSSGANLRVYPTKKGNMGVIVAEDLLFPDTVRTLSACGSDFIVCPFGKVNRQTETVLRALAYLYGLPIFFCGKEYSAIASPSGDLDFLSNHNPTEYEYTIVKEYHLVETRRRGVWKR